MFQHVAHLLGTGTYFFLKIMGVIIKIEVREITFRHAVITWNFFLIFYCCKIVSFGLLKVRFERKKHKDMADDCSSRNICFDGSRGLSRGFLVHDL